MYGLNMDHEKRIKQMLELKSLVNWIKIHLRAKYKIKQKKEFLSLKIGL